MEAFQPFQRRGHQEADHLGAAEVIDQRIPVLMKALARVPMLVERGAVEVSKAVSIGREMRRHPVEDDADARLVAGVDETSEVGGRAVAGGRREQAEWLVAPGAAKRVLHDRHQLDMGEAHVLHIGDEMLGEEAPGDRLAVWPLPGAGMYLVDGERCRLGLKGQRGCA